jgi:hypothetical protein
MSWPLLIFLPFLLVVAVGLAFVALSRRSVQRAAFDNIGSAPTFPQSVTSVHWIVVSSNDPQLVDRMLDETIGPKSGKGIVKAWSPGHPWVIAVGEELPDAADDIDALFLWLQRVSARFGEVQYFSFDRITASQAWARVVDGRIIRGFAWSGSTLWNQGALTLGERRLSMWCPGYGEDQEESAWAWAEKMRANVDRIPELGASWGVHPVRVGLRRWARAGDGTAEDY